MLDSDTMRDPDREFERGQSWECGIPCVRIYQRGWYSACNAKLFNYGVSSYEEGSTLEWLAAAAVKNFQV